ncbi:hypothetical protein [Serratia sp. (in: enterobacteria)]|uniref:hypothetical protein n=1 Tax=Serratia sp. (in: enterobacteria) TaxID=616 RepID=UPI003988F4AC
MTPGRFTARKPNIENMTDAELEAAKGMERLAVRTSEVIEVREGEKKYRRIRRA